MSIWDEVEGRVLVPQTRRGASQSRAVHLKAPSDGVFPLLKSFTSLPVLLRALFTMAFKAPHGLAT